MTEWKEGDRLSWSGERWTFWQFDPDYPRAICQSDKLRVCAIDITSAKRLDPATERKQAERHRRKERGEVALSGWLSAEDHAALVAMAREAGMTQGQVVARLIGMRAAVLGLQTFDDFGAWWDDGQWVRHSDLTAAVGL